MRDDVAYAVTTWGGGSKLTETLDNLPPGAHVLVVDTKAKNWPLARGWNHAIDHLLGEGFKAVIVMNDDVVLRQDTGDLLAWAILEGQFSPNQYRFDPPDWEGHPELLLITPRHASPSDACTDVVDRSLLDAAEPRWQPGPDFACFCVTESLFREVGRFDEGFPAYFEDNDMHRRIQLAGFEAGAFAPYWHFRNGTIRSDPERRAAVHRIFETSKAHYIAKWGGYLGQERYDVPFGQTANAR